MGLPARACLLLTICAVFALAQGAQNNDVQNTAAGTVRLHQTWGPKGSAPGTSLELREVSRSGPEVVFRLFAHGVDPDGAYSLVAWPVSQKGPSTVVKGVTLGSGGLAICPGRPDTCGSAAKPNDPVEIKLTPIAGEPVRLALISANNQVRVFAKTVPNPIRGKDRSCALEAVLLTPGAELVLLEGEGFAPNTEVTMSSASGGESHSQTAKVGADGKYLGALLPFTAKATSGVAAVTLKGVGCAPAVKVNWGRR